MKNKKLKVNIFWSAIFGWLNVIFFIGFSSALFFNKLYIPAIFLWIFILIGLRMIFFTGVFYFDERGVTHKNMFGYYHIQWSEVTHIEKGIRGTLALYGKDKRFILNAQNTWSGYDKSEAIELLKYKIKEFSLTTDFGKFSDYQFHKNVKVS